jgi:hypothetical protein
LADECDERQEKEPLIVVLDSLGAKHYDAVQDILEYLTVEWGGNAFIDKSDAAFPFNSSEMVITTPKCPGQPDLSSCGLYLIEYMSKTFEDINKFCFLDSYRTINGWANEDDMKMQRSTIAALLKEVSKKQDRFDHLIFPDINFFPPSGTSLTSEEEDWAYFNDYVTSAAENQRDFSLCRQYSLQTFVRVDRYRQFVVLLDNLQHKTKTQCIQIKMVKDYLTDDHSFTEPEIMCCLNQMEQDGSIMIDQNEIYFRTSL